MPGNPDSTDPPPDPTVHQVLEIKKYPNRRLYDASRSCHVTLGELYDLVAAGHVVRVRDSKSGEDITNQVLVQAMVERDPLKVTAVPTPLIHLMIRMNQQLITSWFDLGLRQIMEVYRTAAGGGGGWPNPMGNPWWPGAAATGMRAGWPMGTPPWPALWGGGGTASAAPERVRTPATDLLGGAFPSPMSWLASFLQAPDAPARPAADDVIEEGEGEEIDPEERDDADTQDVPDVPDVPDDPADLETLQRQVAALAAEVSRLRSERDS